MQSHRWISFLAKSIYIAISGITNKLLQRHLMKISTTRAVCLVCNLMADVVDMLSKDTMMCRVCKFAHQFQNSAELTVQYVSNANSPKTCFTHGLDFIISFKLTDNIDIYSKVALLLVLGSIEVPGGQNCLNKIKKGIEEKKDAEL